MANRGIELLLLLLTTRRRRGSRILNRFVKCFCIICIIASRITLEFNGDSVTNELPIGHQQNRGAGDSSRAYVEKEGRRRIRLSSGWSPSCSYPSWSRFAAIVATLPGIAVHLLARWRRVRKTR